MSATSQPPACLYSSLQLDEQLCFALHASARAITGVYMETLDAHGLTYPQYLVLICLIEDDGLSVGALGKRLSLDSGTLTPLVKRLEEKGLVRRERSKDDERRVRVWLTEAGWASRDIALQARSLVVDRLGMTEAEISDLRATLMTVTNRLKFGRPLAASDDLAIAFAD